MAGLGVQKGYLGGYYGTNAWNAKTLRIYTDSPEFGKGKNAIDYNIIDQRNFESRLFNLFIQRFRWEGLPCPEYYLEQSILFNGLSVAFQDELLGNIILPAVIESRNVYNEPIVVRAIGLDFNKAINVGDDYVNGEGVLMYDNPLFFPPFLQLQRTAQIAGDLNRTIEIYGRGMKAPMLLYANDETCKSIKMVAELIQENQPYATIIKDYDKKDKKIPMVAKEDITQYNAPNTASELRGLMMHMEAFIDDTMSIYGFGMGAGAKMAQVSNQEASASNAIAYTNLQVAFALRKRFCKAINKLFGTDKIKVSINIADPQENEEESKGGKGNGAENKDPVSQDDSKPSLLNRGRKYKVGNAERQARAERQKNA